LRVGHVYDEFVAFGMTDVGEPDAGVAGCTFDYGAARFEEAALFRVENAVECCTVFDGAAGVLEFSFAENFAACGFGEVL